MLAMEDPVGSKSSELQTEVRYLVLTDFEFYCVSNKTFNEDRPFVCLLDSQQGWNNFCIAYVTITFCVELKVIWFTKTIIWSISSAVSTY